MNMKKFFSVTLDFLRQFAIVFLATLSLFVVIMSVKVHAETYEYDALNRVTKVIYDDQSYTVYEYDANGNITNQNYYEKEESNTDENIPPKDEEDDDSEKDPPPKEEPPASGHKTGMKAESSNATYVITSVKKRTAAFYRLKNKKKTRYAVPHTVKIDGITYKVTKISANAFKNNKKIRKVTIGKNITNIGKRAFYGCQNLKNIIIKTTKLKSVGKQAFKGIHKKAIIKIPRKKYEKYKKLLKGKGQKKTVQIKKR